LLQPTYLVRMVLLLETNRILLVCVQV
jgi:hypothetical protein